MGKAIVIPIESGKEKILLAEHTVIGSVIFDSRCLPMVESIITPADFAYPQNEEIFAAILKVQAEGLHVDLVSVTEYLHRTGKLDAIGGPMFLVDITDNVGSASQAAYYAKLIREASLSRKYADVCKQNHLEAQEAADGKCRLHEILASHETRLFSISRDYYRSHVTTPIAEMVIGELRRMEDITTVGADGVMTGFVDLDNLTNGIKQSELIYLAARPGVGKTALALNIANNCGVPVGFFSLEMSASEIAKRQLSLLSGVDGYLLRSLRLSSSDWNQLTSVAATMEDLKIFVDDKPQLSIQELRSQARQLVAKHGAKLIIIDYLQIMKVSRPGRSREQEISDISCQLKTMAKELSIPVICLAQLNREVEKRDSKKPKLSDLRESGSLEQDADMVLFLWPDGKDSIAVNFSVAKNRNGRTGEGKLMLNKSTLKFYDWTE